MNFSAGKYKRTVTCFGEDVDERVSLAALVQLRQLRAAVQIEVVDAEASLPVDGGVQQGALGNGGADKS